MTRKKKAPIVEVTDNTGVLSFGQSCSICGKYKGSIVLSTRMAVMGGWRNMELCRRCANTVALALDAFLCATPGRR